MVVKEIKDQQHHQEVLVESKSGGWKVKVVVESKLKGQMYQKKEKRGEERKKKGLGTWDMGHGTWDLGRRNKDKRTFLMLIRNNSRG